MIEPRAGRVSIVLFIIGSLCGGFCGLLVPHAVKQWSENAYGGP
jgi:hypothetical protein